MNPHEVAQRLLEDAALGEPVTITPDEAREIAATLMAVPHVFGRPGPWMEWLGMDDEDVEA